MFVKKQVILCLETVIENHTSHQTEVTNNIANYM